MLTSMPPWERQEESCSLCRPETFFCGIYCHLLTRKIKRKSCESRGNFNLIFQIRKPKSREVGTLT